MQVETHFVPTIFGIFWGPKYTLAVRKPTFKFDEIFIFQNAVVRYCFKNKLSQLTKSLFFTCFLIKFHNNGGESLLHNRICPFHLRLQIINKTLKVEIPNQFSHRDLLLKSRISFYQWYTME